VKYDDASWHYGGDFPKGLPPKAGATHIGIFLAWMILNGFASEELLEEEDDVQALKDREMTGAEFLMSVLDEKMTDDDFNAEGNAFALAYYEGRDHDSKYADDYFECLNVDNSSLYGVEDIWANYDAMFPRIAERFATWKEQGCPTYIC
jgi:hypothetical protein